MGKLHTRTVKLKLRVVAQDRKASWKRLRQLARDTWRAANWIASGQHMNDQLMRRLYARRKLDPTDMDAVAAAEEEFRAVFGTKRQATTERDIKEHFPDLPPCVTNRLNNDVVSSYNQEKKSLLAGERSLRTYRKGTPVPTTKGSIRFANSDGTHAVTWKLGRKEQLDFEVYYGRDKAGNQKTISRILDGENDYSAPSIQLNDKGLFLLLPVKEPERELELDPDLAVGVDLGMSVVAFAALSEGPARGRFGFGADLLKVRTQMQSRRRRYQRSVVSARGGHGRQRKLKALDRLKKQEAEFRRSYNHMISRRVVDFAMKQRAGTIKLELLEGFGTDEGHAFALRNWSYFDLQKDIEYKAKRLGIAVKHVDPYHTSQTCSACGHYEPGQRTSQERFVCKACGEEANADHNAALNIARSETYVTSKEQCAAYKEAASGRDNRSTTAGPTAEG